MVTFRPLLTGLTGPTTFRHTLRTYIVGGLGSALLKKILGKPKDPVGAMFHNVLSSPPLTRILPLDGPSRS